MDKLTVAQRLHTLRTAKNVTFEQLSAIIHIPEAVLIDYESGIADMTEAHAIILSEYYSVEPEDVGYDILIGKEYPPSFLDLVKIGKGRSLKVESGQWFKSFKNAFRKKTREEKMEALENQLFHPEKMGDESPFLFIKIVAILALLFGASILITDIPMTVIALETLVPFGLLWYMFEKHQPRSVNGFDVLRLFVFGGMVAIYFVLYMRKYVGYPDIPVLGELLTGLVEETAKITIVILFASRIKVVHTMTGILLGFAVGAGFAAFETGTYGIIALMQSGEMMDMIGILLLRSTFALLGGVGHHFWTGMLAGALVSINKTGHLSFRDFRNPIPLIWFGIVVLLHTVWNFAQRLTGTPLLIIQIVLSLVTLVLFILMWTRASRKYYHQSHSDVSATNLPLSGDVSPNAESKEFTAEATEQ